MERHWPTRGPSGEHVSENGCACGSGHALENDDAPTSHENEDLPRDSQHPLSAAHGAHALRTGSGWPGQVV